MSVAIRKLDGVASVEVSLNAGTADVKLKRGNRLDPERIRQAARDNGFTPKGAEATVAGKLVERGGRPALEVTGIELVYALAEHPDAKGRLDELKKSALGTEVVVSGSLPETKAETGEPRALQVRDFTLGR